MKQIMNIKIVLPENLVCKQEFTLGEVFSLDENRQAFEDVVNNEVKLIAKAKESEIEQELKLKFSDQLEEYKKQVQEVSEKEIAAKIETEKVLLKSEQEKVEFLKNANNDLKQSLSKVESVYETKLNEEKRIITEKHAIEIANMKKLTSNEIGDMGEDEVISKITDMLPEDKVTKPSAQAGEADVLIEMSNGETIYIEVKNRKNWTTKNYENFAAKTRNRSDAGALFISKALPKNSKDFIAITEEFFYNPVDDVYLTSFANFAPAVYTIRQLTSKYSRKLREANASQETQKKLFDFIGSSEYENYFAKYKKNIDELEKVFKAIQKESSKGLGTLSTLNIEIDNLYSVTSSKKIED